MKILRFHCGYFRLMCVCMCHDVTQLCENSVFSLQLFPVYVSVCDVSCENSVFLLQLSPAYMYALVLFVWTGLGWLQGI